MVLALAQHILRWAKLLEVQALTTPMSLQAPENKSMFLEWEWSGIFFISNILECSTLSVCVFDESQLMNHYMNHI